MKTWAKSILCGSYKYTGLLRLQESLSSQQFLVILLFHRVTDEIPEDGLTVGVGRFRRLCRMFRDRFRVVPLAEVFRLARTGGPWPRRTLAVTFDDCYRDNLLAARILAEHGLPATFFVPPGFVGTDRTFPWDQGLKRLPNLTWDEVREMARLDHEIGSHTVSHADLGAVGEEEARREIVDSKAAIEEQVGRPVRWLAYPFGGVEHFQLAWLPILEEAGYDGCLSGYGGFVRPGADSRLLPREPAPAFSSNLNLELHLTGCLEWVYRWKRRWGWSKPLPEYRTGDAARERIREQVPLESAR